MILFLNLVKCLYFFTKKKLFFINQGDELSKFQLHSGVEFSVRNKFKKIYQDSLNGC